MLDSNAYLCPHCFAPFAAGAVVCPACGAQVENQNPQSTLPYGAVVAAQYVIGTFLQADGEGLVYEGYERVTARCVQIKEYLPITLSEDRAQDGTVSAKRGSGVLFKTTRMDFADLYRSLQTLTPAAGLHTVLDVVEDYNTVYAVLGQLHGMPLGQYLKEVAQAGVLSPNAAHALLGGVFEGIATLHAAGLVHRGISPENIIVQPDGTTCLTGYATIGLRTVGSVLRPQIYEGYSAPEQYTTAEFEGRYTDVYCLAGVYYRLVTGQSPASAAQRLVVDSNPSARSLVPSLPRHLSEVLVLALRLRPAERLQTVSELSECLGSAEVAQAFLLETKRIKRNKRKKNGATGVVGVAVIIIAALLCLLSWLLISGFAQQEEPVVVPEPTPTAEPTPEPIYVDNFVGLLYSQLVSTSVYNDKYLFYVASEQYSDEVAGTILSQSPAADAMLGDDVTISLVVSKGPEMVNVPQVFGFTQESAAEELNAAGLTASFVMKVNDGSYASGCVIKTDPEAGTEVQTGTTITVYIAADRDVSVITNTESTDTTGE